MIDGTDCGYGTVHTSMYGVQVRRTYFTPYMIGQIFRMWMPFSVKTYINIFIFLMQASTQKQNELFFDAIYFIYTSYIYGTGVP